MPPESAEIHRSLVKAERDWSVALKAIAPPKQELDAAAFHCRQATEKTLKAYLVSQERPFERIHDFGRLIKRRAESDAAFLDLYDDVAPLPCMLLRFDDPGPADPTLEHVRSALAIVAGVWDFVAARVPYDIVPATPEEN